MRLMTANDIESYYAWIEEQDRLAEEELAAETDRQIAEFEKLHQKIELGNQVWWTVYG